MRAAINAGARFVRIAARDARDEKLEGSVQLFFITTRAIIAHCDAPTREWPYAITYSAHILNRLPVAGG